MNKTGLDPIVIRGQKYEDRGYCRTPWGGIHGDGPVIHTVYCERAGGRWTASSGSDCIREGQDGAKIQADREISADRARFTPPEYRQVPEDPGSVITVDKRQPTQVLALRGRPRAPGAQWATWETYDMPSDGTLWGDLKRMTERPQPAEMTTDEAKDIVSEFEARVPTHEFKVVLARLVVTEEQIA